MANLDKRRKIIGNSQECLLAACGTQPGTDGPMKEKDGLVNHGATGLSVAAYLSGRSFDTTPTSPARPGPICTLK